MHDFKAGTKVRCVKGLDWIEGLLTVGKTYTVLHYQDKSVAKIIADNGLIYYFATDLFEVLDLPKYILIEAKKDDFLEQVNELIAQGYKPQGGVVVDQQFYIQAMVLED